MENRADRYEHNGKEIVFYHGTHGKEGAFEPLSYFTSTKTVAKRYGNKIYPAYLHLFNPLVLSGSPGTTDYSLFIDVGEDKMQEYKDFGYDSILYFGKLEDADSEEMISAIVFETEQVEEKKEEGGSLSKGGAVDLPAFKKWFDGSKVVDSNGNPLIIYHGTNANEFHQFKLQDKPANETYGSQIADNQLGFFFTENKLMASFFAGLKYFHANKGKYVPVKKPEPNARIIPCYLSIKNPYIIDSTHPNWDADNDRDSFQLYFEEIQMVLSAENYRAQLIKQGYDGIILRNNTTNYYADGDYNIYVAFYPTQIKLADGSNTTFDGNNPDIRFAKGGTLSTNDYERIIHSEAFIKLFGDWRKAYYALQNDPGLDEVSIANMREGVSKVLDATGKPLVVYHGTVKKFTEFKYSADIGFHFGSSKDQAIRAMYSKIDWLSEYEYKKLPEIKYSSIYNGETFTDTTRGYLLPCFLSIKNPLYFNDATKWDPIFMAADLLAENIFTKAEHEAIRRKDFNEGCKLLVKTLKAKGCDGIIYENKYEGEGTSYIVFDSNQIKLADENTTFESGNQDIRFAKGGPTKTYTIAELQEQYKATQTPNDIEVVSEIDETRIQLKLQKVTGLPKLTSASAIECINGKLYIMGDDATHLLVANTDLGGQQYTRMFAGEGRIPKAEKKDIEASTIIKNPATDEYSLLMSGSASLAQREVFVVAPISNISKFKIIDGSHFFKRVRETGLEYLNIEGMANIAGQCVVMSNRGDRTNPTNHLIFTGTNFYSNQSLTSIHTVEIKLPQGLTISGLCYIPFRNLLLFTASNEETPNAFEDGAIGDSYIGWFNNFTIYSRNKQAISPDLLMNLTENDTRFKGQKIEGVCVEDTIGNSRTNFVIHMVADNDDGSSNVFEAMLNIPETFETGGPAIQTYYNTHGEPMSVSEFIELEVEERENYPLEEIEEWKQKYGFTNDDSVIWVTDNPKSALTYNADAQSYYDIEKLSLEEFEQKWDVSADDLFTYTTEQGYLIPESDDGDHGFLMVLNRPKMKAGGLVPYKQPTEPKPLVVNEVQQADLVFPTEPYTGTLQPNETSFTGDKSKVLGEIGIYYNKHSKEDTPIIRTSNTSFEFLWKIWDKHTIELQESFYVLYLNRNMRIIAWHSPFKGGVASTVADKRIVVATAAKVLASAVIIAHNHPSGNTTPSKQDKELTKELKVALATIDVELADSMIITPNKTYFSFVDDGLMFEKGGKLSQDGEYTGTDAHNKKFALQSSHVPFMQVPHTGANCTNCLHYLNIDKPRCLLAQFIDYHGSSELPADPQNWASDWYTPAITDLLTMPAGIDIEGKGKFNLPKGHNPFIRVAKGGSSCANCKFLSEDKKHCTNKDFTEWYGKTELPENIHDYCSDWYEPVKDKMQDGENFSSDFFANANMKVYRGQKIGSSGKYFTSDRSIAVGYGPLSGYGREIITKDIGGRKFIPLNEIITRYEQEIKHEYPELFTEGELNLEYENSPSINSILESFLRKKGYDGTIRDKEFYVFSEGKMQQGGSFILDYDEHIKGNAPPQEDTPKKQRKFFYHGVKKHESVQRILAEGFNLTHIKPLWQNDYAISTLASPGAVRKFFGRSLSILKLEFNGVMKEYNEIPKHMIAKDAQHYTRQLVGMGIDAVRLGGRGGQVFIYNPKAIKSIELLPDEPQMADGGSFDSWVGEHKARQVFTKTDKPKTQAGLDLADKIEDALNVIDEYYQGFTESSVKRAMIQTRERNYGGGRRVGVAVKAEPYANQFGVQVNGITGGYDIEITDRGATMEMDEDAKLYHLGKTYHAGLPTKDEMIDDFAVLDLLAAFPAKALITRDASHSLVYPTAKDLFETGYKSMDGKTIEPITVDRALEFYNSGAVEKTMEAKTKSNEKLPPIAKNNFADDLRNSITNEVKEIPQTNSRNFGAGLPLAETTDDAGIMTMLFFCNLQEADYFKLSGKTIVVLKVVPEKYMKLFIKGVEKKVDYKYGQFVGSWGKKHDWFDQIYRDVESNLIVDLINRNNKFHEFSEFWQIAHRDSVYKMQKGGKPDTPIKAYHGTVSGFDVFNTEPVGRSFSGLGETAIGSHFSESKDIAGNYPFHINPGQKRVIKEVELNIRNPKKYTTLNKLREDLYDFIKENNLSIKFEERLKNVAAFKKKLISEGYDGLVYKEGFPYNIRKDKVNTWVAFFPEQITVLPAVNYEERGHPLPTNSKKID